MRPPAMLTDKLAVLHCLLAALATAIPSAATNCEGSHSVRLLCKTSSVDYTTKVYIRTGSAAHLCIIWFLVIFLCIVTPPAAPRSGRVKFVFLYRTSYVGLTSRQHLATVIRYADCVKTVFSSTSASPGGKFH